MLKTAIDYRRQRRLEILRDAFLLAKGAVIIVIGIAIFFYLGWIILGDAGMH